MASKNTKDVNKMTGKHLISPPLELIEQWHSNSPLLDRGKEVAARAAQWGANQELEACCEVLVEKCFEGQANLLRGWRRPKPPSLKEEAMQALCRFMAGEGHDDCTEEEIEDDFKTIRRALDALPDD